MHAAAVMHVAFLQRLGYAMSKGVEGLIFLHALSHGTVDPRCPGERVCTHERLMHAIAVDQLTSQHNKRSREGLTNRALICQGLGEGGRTPSVEQSRRC